MGGGEGGDYFSEGFIFQLWQYVENKLKAMGYFTCHSAESLLYSDANALNAGIFRGAYIILKLYNMLNRNSMIWAVLPNIQQND